VVVAVTATLIFGLLILTTPSSSMTHHTTINNTTNTSTTTTYTNGQPLLEAYPKNFPASIPATGGHNVTTSCQRPSSTNFGTIVIVNNGTGGAALKILVIQYPELPSNNGFATSYLVGKSCSVLPPNSAATLYITGLPATASAGSYFDGWFVLTSGAQSNVFSGQFG
jgi:hypothetical protein